jgi:hypothetical protein
MRVQNNYFVICLNMQYLSLTPAIQLTVDHLGFATLSFDLAICITFRNIICFTARTFSPPLISKLTTLFRLSFTTQSIHLQLPSITLSPLLHLQLKAGSVPC